MRLEWLNGRRQWMLLLLLLLDSLVLSWLPGLVSWLVRWLVSRSVRRWAGLVS